jgi:hypothetical protein
MNHFISIEKNYFIPHRFVMMLDILVSWSPKSCGEYGWKNHLFAASSKILQATLSGLLKMDYFLVPLASKKVV